MDNTTNLSIRMDKKLKEQADALFSELGMNMTTALNIFVRQSVREQGIPFHISAEIPNAETRQAIENVRNKIGLSKGFSSVKELMEDLNADD